MNMIAKNIFDQKIPFLLCISSLNISQSVKNAGPDIVFSEHFPIPCFHGCLQMSAADTNSKRLRR